MGYDNMDDWMNGPIRPFCSEPNAPKRKKNRVRYRITAVKQKEKTFDKPWRIHLNKLRNFSISPDKIVFDFDEETPKAIYTKLKNGNWRMRGLPGYEFKLKREKYV